MGGGVGALGEDGHGGDGQGQRLELGVDEFGEEREVGEDEGVETGGGEDVGVGVEDLKELRVWGRRSAA